MQLRMQTSLSALAWRPTDAKVRLNFISGLGAPETFASNLLLSTRERCWKTYCSRGPAEVDSRGSAETLSMCAQETGSAASCLSLSLHTIITIRRIITNYRCLPLLVVISSHLSYAVATEGKVYHSLRCCFCLPHVKLTSTRRHKIRLTVIQRSRQNTVLTPYADSLDA